MRKLLIILFVLCLCVSTFGQFIPIKMFGQQPSGPFADGLVFLWRGIEAGNAVDESFSRNHGTITGATWVGDGLSFSNGDTDYVDMGNPGVLNPTGPFTVSVWIKPASVSITTVITSKSDGSGSGTHHYILQVSSDIRFYVGGVSIGNAGVYTNALSVGKWSNIVGVHTGSATHLYFDGVFRGAADSYTAPDVAAANFLLGKRSDLVTNLFYGTMSDVKFYGRALSASEIQALFINPNLPMQQQPIWLLFSPAAPSAGQVIIISKAEDKNEWATPPMWACLFDNRYWLN